MIYEGANVILGETHLVPGVPNFRRESVAEVWPNIAFSLKPVGIVQADAELVIGDANTAILFTVGRPYRRVSIDGYGSSTEWIEVRPDVLSEMVREHEPAAESKTSTPFRIGGAPVPAGTYLAHRRARWRLARHGISDGLALEESALAIAAQVLSASFAVLGLSPKPATQNGERAARSLVFEVKALLNRRLGQPLALNDISRAVHVSPYHLCRVFRETTGVPIHKYRNGLRLRVSLEMIAEPDARILDTALELGYANEAHFSDAFQKTFGLRPSAFRRTLRRLGSAAHGADRMKERLGVDVDDTRIKINVPGEQRARR